MTYESKITYAATCCEGVHYTIRRMSFGRRVELTRLVRELGARMEFREAGDELTDKLEARLLSAEIDRLYLEWGLVSVSGLELDGSPASPGALIGAGPEDLCREILAAIKGECGLSDEERKN
ncbi:MAG: hypothetical protein ABJF23_21155 [Bryobacteraceae bacterium]